MSHTYSSNRVHIIFSTKNRAKQIPPEIQRRLWAYMVGIARNHGFEALKVGGVEDHVHALLVVPPTMPLSKAVQLLKGCSSKHMNDMLPAGGFSWQEGYAAFSVSAPQTPHVAQYIETQAEHHARRSYEEEFLEFLKSFGVNFDPQHVFG